jgi:hypothetical protein
MLERMEGGPATRRPRNQSRAGPARVRISNNGGRASGERCLPDHPSLASAAHVYLSSRYLDGARLDKQCGQRCGHPVPAFVRKHQRRCWQFRIDARELGMHPSDEASPPPGDARNKRAAGINGAGPSSEVPSAVESNRTARPQGRLSQLPRHSPRCPLGMPSRMNL